jgi:2,4-dienoyl-CoA reductase-like NADH-dependent reductase (Old Yellow Enzyme family)
MSRDLSALFRPFSLKSLRLANRIVMSPMGRNFARDGVVGSDYRDYFRRRAAAGVALCIGEASAVEHPVAATDVTHAHFHGEEALAGWRDVASAVHDAGGAFMPQIWHAGVLRGLGPSEQIPNSLLAPIGPSGWAEPLVHRVGWVNAIETSQRVNCPMSQADIDAVVDAFARAARWARDIGCDGVEIHGAHGYIIDQFFWERTNRRDDRYGGDLVARTRFAAEVIAECRRQVGAEFPLFFRWSQWKQQDYHVRLAQSPHELERFLTPLADAGVDLFDCSTRRFWEPEFEGNPLNLAGWTKKLTGKPTMTVGSVGLARSNWIDEEGFSLSDSALASLDPLIEKLDRGEFDLVAVGRALIANPEWPRALKEGRAHTLHPYTNDSLLRLE